MDSKKPWQSKTIIMGIIAALVPLFPPVSEWIAANPAVFSSAMGLVFTALRVISKDKISIS